MTLFQWKTHLKIIQLFLTGYVKSSALANLGQDIGRNKSNMSVI